MSHALSIVRGTEDDRAVLEQLWTMFRHERSDATLVLPDANGRFRQARLDSGLADPAWAAYLFRLGTAPVGLAVVRALDSDEAVISSFFVVRGARRGGHGRAAVRTITEQRPGRWAVAFQDSNEPAVRFWTAVASEVDPDWSLQHRPVPNRPDLPPDAWIHFAVS